MSLFNQEVSDRIVGNSKSSELLNSADVFMRASIAQQYSYNFSWLGRPIIQYPQDIVAMQELIWAMQPDLIIETGIAHGGSLIFSASMLAINAMCGGPQNPEVVAVDIDIRSHNREAIEAHPMSKFITMIQGSSIAPEIVQQVQQKTVNKQKVLVCLDSNHTHDHVLAELEAYGPMTSMDSYCIVFDTVVEDLPADLAGDRPWGPGNNPKTAVWKYLQSLKDNKPVAQDGKPLNFEIDKSIDHKLLVSVAPDGYLKRVI
jgi:cephalosporin hydroxylase